MLGGGVHGSGLVTQGESQCLATATVGRDSEERRNESVLGKNADRVMVHWNSPLSAASQACFLPDLQSTHNALPPQPLIMALKAALALYSATTMF